MKEQNTKKKDGGRQRQRVSQVVRVLTGWRLISDKGGEDVDAEKKRLNSLLDIDRRKWKERLGR